MNKLVTSVASFIFASLGWWVGDLIGGVFTSFVVSMIGTGVGVYAGRRLLSYWEF